MAMLTIPRIQYCIGYLFLYFNFDAPAQFFLKQAVYREDEKATCELARLYWATHDKVLHGVAVDLAKKAAQKGSLLAKELLVYRYLMHEDLPEMRKQIVVWTRDILAEKEDAFLMNEIGIYELNYRTNYKVALSWFHKSAALDNSNAMMNIGYMYEAGLSVKRDLNKALEWQKKSAHHGNHNAQMVVGSFYHFGLLGGVADREEALQWYAMAQENNPCARARLGVLLLDEQQSEENIGYRYLYSACKSGIPEACDLLKNKYKAESAYMLGEAWPLACPLYKEDFFNE